MYITEKITMIRETAKKCLETKWIKEQNKNMSYLIYNCPFCDNAKNIRYNLSNTEKTCNFCECPKILCSSSFVENKSLFRFIEKEFIMTHPSTDSNDIRLRHIDSELYQLMRKGLSELSENGEISKETELNIKKIIGDNQKQEMK